MLSMVALYVIHGHEVNVPLYLLFFPSNSVDSVKDRC